MSVVYLNEERYCQVCSHPLGPDDDPRGFHRGKCPAPLSHSVTEAQVTVAPPEQNPAKVDVTPAEVCPKCGYVGSHTANYCRQRRHRARQE